MGRLRVVFARGRAGLAGAPVCLNVHQRARQLDADWKELLKRQGIEAEDRKRKKALAAQPWTEPMLTYRGQNEKRNSVNTGGNALLKPSPVYTGTKMLGIGQLHKSNAVPVFSNEEAIDIARMRR